MPLSPAQRSYAWAVSLFIVLVLTAQFMVVPLKIAGHGLGMWYWPIIDYPMYETAHAEGDYLMAYYDVRVTLKDGSQEQVSKRDLSIGTYPFLYMIRGMVQGKERDVSRFVSLHPEGREIATVEIYTPPYVVTRTGYGERPPKLLRSIALNRES